MPVILSPSIRIVSAQPDIDDAAVILIDNVFRRGTVTASSDSPEVNGYFENAIDGLTFDWWQPSSLPAWLSVDLAVSSTVDCGLIAAHNGITFVFQYHDGDSWVDLHEPVETDSTAVFMPIFEEVEALKYRLRIIDSIQSVGRLGVAMLGKSIKMPRPFYGGHAPLTLNRKTEINPIVTEGGFEKGIMTLRTGAATSVQIQNAPANWVRDNVEQINKALEILPFGFAWRPGSEPSQVGYCWLNQPIRATNSGIRDLMTVTFDLEAHIGGFAVQRQEFVAILGYTASPKLTVASTDLNVIYDYQGAGAPAYKINAVAVYEPLSLVVVASTTSPQDQSSNQDDRSDLKAYIATTEGLVRVPAPTPGVTSGLPIHRINSISFHPSGKWVALACESLADANRRLHIFEMIIKDDVISWKFVQLFRGPESFPLFRAAAYSPDGELLVASHLAGQNRLLVTTVDQSTGVITTIDDINLGLSSVRPGSIKWSDDSRFIFIRNMDGAGGRAVMLLDRNNSYAPHLVSQSQTQFPYHHNNGVAVHPSGNYLVTCGMHNVPTAAVSLMLWDINSDGTLTWAGADAIIGRPTTGIYAIEWLSDDTLVAAVDNLGFAVFRFSGGVLTRDEDYLLRVDARSTNRCPVFTQPPPVVKPWDGWTPDSALAYCWYDPDDDNVATIEGVQFSALDDLSDNENDVAQATEANRPYVSIINFRRAMSFQGDSSQRLFGDLNGVDLDSDYTAIAVVEAGPAVAAPHYHGIVSIKAANDASIGSMTIARYVRNDRQVLSGWSNGTNLGSSFGSYPNSAHPPEIIVMTKKDGELSTRVNGEQIEFVSASASLSACEFIELGRFTFSSGRTWYGKIGEFYFGPADTERLEGYLAWKWGLQDDLADGHPYKNAPPVGES